MPETNGNVKKDDFFRELKELRGDITKILVRLETYHSEVSAAAVDRSTLKEAVKELSTWKREMEDRVDTLESKDNRFVAIVAGVATVVSAFVTGLVTLVISLFS